MKKLLLDVLFRSEKRKAVLLLLEDGAKEMNTLLKAMKTSRQSLLPQIKILEEHHLIIHYDDSYELTTIGKLIVDRIVPFLSNIEILDNDIDYWGSRYLDFIPPYLLEKLGQLKNCEVISPSLEEVFSIHKSLNPEYKVSPNVYVVTTIIYPDFDSIVTEMLENNVDLHYIVSQGLLNKIKTEYHEQFTNFIKSKHFNMYVYNKEMKFLYFTFDNVHSLISMFNCKGEFDYKFMLCRGQSAVEWTKDLYEHYQKESTLITEL